MLTTLWISRAPCGQPPGSPHRCHHLRGSVMARAIWSGSISFGMVSIPVKLHGATESKDISFHLLHSTCGTRLKQVRWCPTDEEEVPWSETVRGYAYAK